MDKKKKRFGELFSESFSEFKLNWKVFFILLVVFSFLPSFISTVFLHFFKTGVSALGLNPDYSQLAPVFIKFYIPYIVISLITFILGIWMNSSFIFNSLYKKKQMNLKDSLNGGKKYFWKFLGLNLLLILIIGVPAFILAAFGGYLYVIGFPIGLTLMFSVLVLILMIFFIWISINWIFSSYILIGENKKIIESLRLSKNLVHRKWWKTFGTLLLFLLIIIGIAIIFALISFLINTAINPNYINQAFNPSSELLSTSSIISIIINYILSLFIIPMGIFFFKNFYLSRKEEIKK